MRRFEIGRVTAMLLILCYAAICVVAFNLLRVPVNRWSVTTAVLGAAIIVGGLVAGMNYNHPFTTDGRLYFFTTSISPTVSGQVVDVVAKPNAPLKQGDVLFRIDPKPYSSSSTRSGPRWRYSNKT